MLHFVHRRRQAIALASLCACALFGLCLPQAPDFHHAARTTSYIVQSSSADAAGLAVTTFGGQVTSRLALINGVVADVDTRALTLLRARPDIALHKNGIVQATGTSPSALSAASGDQTASSPQAKETHTSGYLLYPAAATGAYLVRDHVISDTDTLCRDQQVFSTASPAQHRLAGWGVTVAVVDSGFMKLKNRQGNRSGWDVYDQATGTLFAQNDAGRCILYHDFLPRTPANDNDGQNARNSTDQNGHGTHVISTIADNRSAPIADAATVSVPPATPLTTAVGVAPDVNLVVARALGSDGSGSYGDVIQAIEWIVANKAAYNIRVLNLSIYTPVTGPYWADPLNQAVMRAWQAGITVVAAAGNGGPAAGSITVPGNIPYVISAGAVRSGRYNASGADELALYSSRGPTESAFVKPDVVVPASRTIAPMPDASTLARQIPAARIQEKADVDYGIGAPNHKHTYYQLSGTSMAAAEISGIAALIIQANPALTNDQVKYRLLATARPAFDQETGTPVYSPWEQGSGLIDTEQAVLTTTAELANVGMDVNLDLMSDIHYWGNTTWDETTGEFRLIDPDTGQPTLVWDGGSKAWAGGSKAWAGGSKAWAGGSKAWAGGSKAWAGTSTWASGESLWAGSSRIWSGSTPATSLQTASQAEQFVNDDPIGGPAVEPTPDLAPKQVFLPMTISSLNTGDRPER